MNRSFTGLLLAGVAAVSAASAQDAPKFLGFELGEERRYVLGPADELYLGEHASWSIQLRELLGDPAEGVFELAHSWQRPASSGDVAIGALVRVDSAGELRVNAHGFPLATRFETQRQYAGMGEMRYTIRYVFEDGRFVKLSTVDGNDFEQHVAIRTDRDVDLSVPRGVYAFSPAGLDCDSVDPTNLSGTMSPGLPAPTAGAPRSPTMPQQYPNFVDPGSCSEGLFFNPGLLSFVLPSLWEQGTGEYEFVVLTPAGAPEMPGLQAGGQVGGVGAQRSQQQLNREASARASANSDGENLRYVDRVSVPVGTRTREAWRFEGLDVADSVYVDDDGVVLRIDLAVRVLRRGGGPGGAETRLDERDLFVRLLYPSEY